MEASKKRQADQVEILQAAPETKKQCMEPVQDMQWPYLVDDDDRYRHVTFSVPLSDIVLAPPPAVIDDTDEYHIINNPNCNAMKASEKNPDFFHYNGMSMVRPSEDWEQWEGCIKEAKSYLTNRSSLFGKELLSKLCQEVETSLAPTDCIQSYSEQHQSYLQSHGFCKHTAPMVGKEATLEAAYFDLLPYSDYRDKAHINVQVVDESGDVVKVDAYTLALAMDQVMRQQAPLALRQYFAELLLEDAELTETRSRVNYILDPSNQDVLVGDLIPLNDPKQRFICIKWQVQDGLLVIEMEADAEFVGAKE